MKSPALNKLQILVIHDEELDYLWTLLSKLSLKRSINTNFIPSEFSLQCTKIPNENMMTTLSRRKIKQNSLSNFSSAKYKEDHDSFLELTNLKNWTWWIKEIKKSLFLNSNMPESVKKGNTVSSQNE